MHGQQENALYFCQVTVADRRWLLEFEVLYILIQETLVVEQSFYASSLLSHSVLILPP